MLRLGPVGRIIQIGARFVISPPDCSNGVTCNAVTVIVTFLEFFYCTIKLGYNDHGCNEQNIAEFWSQLANLLHKPSCLMSYISVIRDQEAMITYIDCLCIK